MLLLSTGRWQGMLLQVDCHCDGSTLEAQIGARGGGSRFVYVVFVIPLCCIVRKSNVQEADHRQVIHITTDVWSPPHPNPNPTPGPSSAIPLQAHVGPR